MFYSPDILSRRRGFGVYWLAATLGSKRGGAFKRLSRKEVLGCNLKDVCLRLQSPEEPMALRLSSNLLCGITRVYQQQYNLWQADVTHVHQALNKVISEMFKPVVTTSVDEAQDPGQKRREVIGAAHLTLNIDPMLALLRYDPDMDLAQEDWAAFMQPRETPPPCEKSQELSSGVEKDFSFSSPGLGRDPPRAHQAKRLGDITLSEPHVEDYMQQRHSSIHHGDGLGEDYQLGELDVGILEGASPELDAQLGLGPGAAGSRASSAYRYFPLGGAASSSFGGEDGGYQDMGGMDPNDIYFAGNENDGPVRFQIPENVLAELDRNDLDEQVRREHEEVQVICGQPPHGPARADSVVEQQEQALSDQQRSSPAKRQSVELDSGDDEALQQVREHAQSRQKRKRPSKRLKKVSVDREVAMPENEEVRMRREYTSRLQAERAIADRARAVKESQSAASDMLFGPPAGVEGDLADFWKTNVTDAMRQLGRGRAFLDKKRQSELHQHDHEVFDRAGSVDRDVEHGRSGGDELIIGNFPQYDPNEYDPRDHAGDYYDQDEYQGMGGMDPRDIDFGYEVGRAGSQGALTGSGQARASFPWNAEVFSEGGFASLGVASSHVGTAERVSLDTPLRGIGDKRRSRTASLAPSALESGGRAGSRAGSMDLLGAGDELRGFDQEAKLGSDAEGKQDGSAELEQDSLRFLAFIHRQAKQQASRSQDLFFSDVVPVASTEPHVAAAAFLHLLALTSRDQLRVGQDEPYGEIRVDVNPILVDRSETDEEEA